jgi:hypothetical protein
MHMMDKWAPTTVEYMPEAQSVQLKELVVE